MYEGITGIKTIFEDILKTKQDIKGYGNTHLMIELLEHYVPSYIKKRIEEKIFFQLLTEPSQNSRNMQKEDKKSFRETRFIKQLQTISTATYIYGNKVAIITLLKKEPLGILIENEEVSKSQRTLFNILWENAEK
ncbi:MAG: hypothetical protein KatS3mg002_0078 [Candidatus Woesearchaeota archaeon]|nr:MAG: hypothetical protein KatS3mg002_0078 [Candidatus Woesearchaeota archaeon]